MVANANTTLTVQEVADLLRVQQKKVCAWIDAGELRAVNVAQRSDSTNGRWRITREALEQFMTSRTPQARTAIVRRRRKRRQEQEVKQFV